MLTLERENREGEEAFALGYLIFFIFIFYLPLFAICHFTFAIAIGPGDLFQMANDKWQMRNGQ